MLNLRQLWDQAGDRFLLYVPICFMGLLALGSYWMVHSTPPAPPAAAPDMRGHEPDYFMHGFSIKTFDAVGQIRSEVMGERVRHFPDTRLLEIDGIRIRTLDRQGKLSTASADRGLTNEDGSEVQLLGNARVVREASSAPRQAATPRLQYQGEFLHVFMNSERVQSHQPVDLQRGNDHFSADSMAFDNVAQTLELTGRVRGTLVPTPQKN